MKWTYEYRCRRCNAVVRESGTDSESRALTAIAKAALGELSKELNAPTLVSIHRCPNWGNYPDGAQPIGVTDLIGCAPDAT